MADELDDAFFNGSSPMVANAYHIPPLDLLQAGWTFISFTSSGLDPLDIDLSSSFCLRTSSHASSREPAESTSINGGPIYQQQVSADIVSPFDILLDPVGVPEHHHGEGRSRALWK